MRSREHAWSMTDRTRRGITLSWLVLFVLSIMLQYGNLTNPQTTLAVHTGSFELDGDAIHAAGHDWDQVFGSGSGADATTFVTDEVPEQAFEIGGSKDDLNVSPDWAHGLQNVPDKDDILHAFAALYGDVIYFGADRYANDGDSQVGFWFFKGGITPNPDGTFSPPHTVGDLLVVSHFTNGGVTSTIELYQWVGTGGDTNGTLDFIASGQTCTGSPATDIACAVANTGEISSPWSYQAKDNKVDPNIIPANAFFEGGLDLSEVFDGPVPCFTGFLVETRSSQEINAQLKDYATGSFNTCASITIVKDAVPNDAQDFGFTTTGTGLSSFNLDDDADATLSNTKVFSGLNPGAYTVTEGAVAGWDLTNLVCNDANGSVNLGTRTATLSLQASENVTCTYTNTKRGKIIIEKQTNPDGAAGSFGFSGEIVTSLSDGQSAEKGNLVPGTYTVTEANPTPPFDLVMITCDDAAGATDSTGDSGTRTATFRLDPGETVKCTFTNVQRGTITIIKDAVPNDPQDFHYNTTGGLAAFDLDDDANATLSNTKLYNDVIPGSYSVSEVAVEGWDLTDLSCNSSGAGTSTSLNGATASLTLGPAGSIVCTYENTKRGHIIVDKITLPGGDPTSFSFGTTGAGYSGFSLTDAAAPNNQEVLPGSYTVSETVPSGWDLTSATCDNGEAPNSVDVGPGETITCVFTNTKRGTIIVEKQTNPSTDDLFTFTGHAAGQIADNGTIVVDNLQPGIYTSTESDPTPDYDLTSILCDDADSSGNIGTRTATFDLDPGETVKCTFTNTQRGTITIIKDAQPNDAQNFGYDVDGFDGPIFFELDDDANGTLSNMQTFENVPSGEYSVTENTVAGWDLTDLDCVTLGGASAVLEGATANLTMTAGGSITCTYVNSKPSINIVKTAGSAADGAVLVQGPGSVTYTYVVTNTGPIALENIVVMDDNGTATAADDFAVTCPATTLAAGASMTCTATVTVNANRTNVATATGESEQGTEVSDTDDAVVRVPGTSIDKSNNDADGIVGHGQNVTFTILVNVTSGPVTNAIVTDTLPVGQTYVAASQTSNPASTFAISPNGRILTWTFASLPTGSPAATITYHVTIDGNAAGAQTNVAQVCVAEPGVPCQTDSNTLTVPGLTILKDVSGYTGGTAVNGTPIAKVGDTLTYTLNYDISSPPTHNGVITDVVPAGLEYVVGSATSNAQFTFTSYNSATRTLTWNAPLVSVDGTLSFKVTVLATAPAQTQPIVNVAAIDSDETDRDDDDANVLVQVVLAATATPVVTLPPTDTIDSGDQAPSNPGFGLMLALLVLAGFGLVVGYLTPTPGRTRREEVRRR